MRVAIACLLVVVFGSAWSVQGGEGQSSTAPSSAKAKSRSEQRKSRVWDNESIQSIDGGISVVGDSSATDAETSAPAVDERRSSGRRGAKPAQKDAVSREMAPPFSARTMDGQGFSGASLRGSPVLIQFWATWCPHCAADQGPVDAVARAYANKGLVVLAVDEGEDVKTVEAYLKRRPRACSIAMESDSDLSSAFPHGGFPYYVVLDAEGRVAAKKRGEAGESGLYALLQKAGL